MNLFLRRGRLLALAAMMLGGGFAWAAEEKGAQVALDDGYSLFYDFCNQEADLSLLLWVKTAPPDIADYAKRISATAKDDLAMLKKFGVTVDKGSLPPFEVAARKSMSDDRKEQLLWKNSGAAFAQAVAMTQSEATNYGLHVAKVLAETDSDPDRARAMRKVYEKWSALHAEAYKLAR